ncbi:MAG: DNA-formamidopyrimidine glycosylase, partial [Rhodospirillales bacterium]|nr:DNA-formamidopyrimidine glycosylase [Rhodospirillales bacterium]
MPELPEVETVMRGLTPVMQGRVIREVWCGAKGLRRPFAEGLALRLAGAR